MPLQIWDKAPLIDNTEAFIEHLARLEAQGCRWLVVPFTADESFGSFKCSKCSSDTGLAAVYSIAAHIAFEEEVLRAIKVSRSQAEYEAGFPGSSKKKQRRWFVILVARGEGLIGTT